MHPYPCSCVQEEQASPCGAVHCAAFPISRGGSSILPQRALEAHWAAWRHHHCHSVYLTFHLTAGNRTSALLCVCEDNPEPAYSCCLSVRDGSCIQKSQSRCRGVNNPAPSLLLNGFEFPSSATFIVARSALMMLNNILDYFKWGRGSVRCHSCREESKTVYLRKKTYFIYYLHQHFYSDCLGFSIRKWWKTKEMWQ